MRVSKRVLVTSTAAAVLAGGLGWVASLLSSGPAGALVGIATLASAGIWGLAYDSQGRDRRRQEILQLTSQMLVPPIEEIHITVDGASMVSLLRPGAKVVSFWPRPELEELVTWLVSDRPVGVRLVTGAGGTGKTRLALELASEAETAFGWQCYWLAGGVTEQATTQAMHGAALLDKPLLMIVDYAETRGGLARLVAELLNNEKTAAIRLLLLARSSGEWFQQLIEEVPSVVGDMLAASEPTILGPLSDAASQGEVFSRAVMAFAAKLAVEPSAQFSSELPPDSPALVVHANALLAVLNQHFPSAEGHESVSQNSVIEGLLRHEARYWRATQARYGLDLLPTVVTRVVAVGTLSGADDEPAAVELLSVIGGLENSAERNRAALWLHDLYPAESSGEEWIGALRPDLIAEHLIVENLTGQDALTAALFASIPEDRMTRAITILGRAALTMPGAYDLLEKAIMVESAWMAIPLMTVAIETNPAAGDLLAKVIAQKTWPIELVRQIGMNLPEHSTALAEVGAAVYTYLSEAESGDSERHCKDLVELSSWLSVVGQEGQALDAAEKAVSILCEKVDVETDSHRALLATARNNQANRLSGLGRTAEALVAMEEAVAIRRELATDHPDIYLYGFAIALNNLAGCLSAVGRKEDALSAIDEAIGIHETLSKSNPQESLAPVALLLNNKSVFLSDLRRYDEALRAAQGSVTMRRALAQLRPDAFLPGLAISLNNMSNNLMEVGRPAQAQSAIVEAVYIYRNLLSLRPASYLSELAGTLHNLANCLAKQGHVNEALPRIDEAIKIRRQLAAKIPDAYLEELASSLTARADFLTHLKRWSAALAASKEAVDVRRALDRAHPDSVSEVLAASLNNYSMRLLGLGFAEEALPLIRETVGSYRSLSQVRPDQFGPSVAGSLYNLAQCLARTGHREDALKAVTEAIEINCNLSDAQYLAIEPMLINSMRFAAELLSSLDRNQEADEMGTMADSLENGAGEEP